MPEILYCSAGRSRARRPSIIVADPAGSAILTFKGVDIPGVCRIESSCTINEGGWRSGSNYRFTLAEGVQHAIIWSVSSSGAVFTAHTWEAALSDFRDTTEFVVSNDAVKDWIRREQPLAAEKFDKTLQLSEGPTALAAAFAAAIEAGPQPGERNQ